MGVGEPASRHGERQGDFLGGKYLLGDCLGIGGMGEVYRATNMSLGRDVAVKILNKEHTANEDDVLRFLREARAAAAVRHPNVVDVLDVARDDDGTPFIVQELLSGEDLEQYLIGPARGRLSIEEAIEIMIPVADAVGAAHSRNVVHRDLKPANIFLAKEGSRITPKVLDFGACLYQTVGVLSAKERRMLIGTPHYMAPEQISTAQDIDARVDVWALGVILFELCVGETPFEAEDLNQVLKYVRKSPIPKLREVCPKAPVSLEIAVEQCLDRDRKKRMENATVLKNALELIKAEMQDDKRRRGTAPEAKPAKAPAETPRARAPSLALKPRPTTRRTASRFTLSGPDDESVWDTADLGPKSASRPIEAAPRAKPPAVSAKPSKKITDVEEHRPPRFEPREASLELGDLDDPGISSVPPMGGSSPPKAAAHAPASMPAGGSAADLDLDLEPPPSSMSGRSKPSSLPPVLDPRAASRSSGDAAPFGEVELRASRSAPPAPLGVSSPPPPMSPRVAPPEPQASPPSMRRPPAALVSTSSDLSAAKAAAPWTTAARLTFAATIAVPALAAFGILRFVPSALAPIAHGMRGDSTLASGVLAVVTLVGAAALTVRAFSTERERSKGLMVSSFAAIALGIMMIIVTFSASETAELGIPPSLAVATPFLAPVVPLGIFVYAVAQARAVWTSKYERREAVIFAVLASAMMLLALELGPAGAVRSVPAASAPAARP
ncbi:MAG: protein kinase [Deltaproteobacteria bacterium]|nr:protein kinase [Deltaproteobacteria bacterium]